MPQTTTIEVHFQPIVSVDTGAVVGAEALLRGAIFGEPTPARDIVNHLRREEASVTELLAAHVGRALREWTDAGFDDVWCTINADAVDIEHDTPHDSVSRHLGPHAERLVVEVTELQELHHERSRGTLTGLRDQGVRLAIDDFGVGESTLRQLEVVDPHVLKIDRSFVNGIERRGERAMVQVTLAIAQHAGMSVIAEGVETVDQLARLRELGCELAQGYLFAPAVPPETFLRLLEVGRPADVVA